jgi:hypothetical protein
MSDLVQEAANALVPLMSAGAGVAAQSAAEDAGSGFYAAAIRVAGKLRRYLHGDEEPAAETVEVALRSALADGELGEQDLRNLVSLHATDGDVGGKVGSVGGNAYIDTSIDVGGDFHG